MADTPVNSPITLPTNTALKSPQLGGVDDLLKQAVQQGATIDTLERLMALRADMMAEQAKQAFNESMSAFQEECPVIKKTKAVKTKSGATAYEYAPIESIVSQVKTTIKKHGFRYSTSMLLGEGKVKVICRVVHALGHEEVSEMEVPLGNKTDIMSQSQVVAAASTFAKRYAFLNAFGIMTGDDDDDTASQRGDQQQNTKPAPVQQGRGQQGTAPARAPSNAAPVPASPAQLSRMEKDWSGYMRAIKCSNPAALAAVLTHEFKVDAMAKLNKQQASKFIDLLASMSKEGMIHEAIATLKAIPADAQQVADKAIADAAKSPVTEAAGQGMDPLWVPDQQKVFMLWKEFCKLTPSMHPEAGLKKLLEERYQVSTIGEMRPSHCGDFNKRMTDAVKELRKKYAVPATLSK